MLSPLLDLPLAIPFDDIRPQDVASAVDALIAETTVARDRIAAPRPARTWEDTPGALDQLTRRLDEAWGLLNHLRSVQHSTELEDAVSAATPRISDFYASLSLDEGLFRALRDYSATAEGQALTGARRRYVDRTLADFRRRGAELDESGKLRMRELAGELAGLTQTFSRHVLEATAAWDLVLDAPPAGVPDTALGLLQALAAQKGVAGYRITLAAPAAMAILTYAEDRHLRQEVWTAYNQRASAAPFDNGPVLQRILALRAEQARLLGFPTFADLILQDRMAHDGQTALSFVARLEQQVRAPFQRETDDLAAFAAAHGAAEALAPWDVAFWSERERQALYDLDEEALRPYFSFDRVLKGLFDLTGRLYGLTYRPSTMPTWHADATAWDVLDDQGRWTGTFHTDFFPRPTKKDGAWMNALRTGAPDRGIPHVGLICGNLTPPSGERPALLTLREVETVFHEFGHLLHHLLTDTELRTQAGTAVAWDFVELPSQIMENWCWERESLDLFAAHWQTGDRLPDPLFERMKRARNFRAASFVMRQVGFCQMDLDLHTRYDPARDGDAVRWSRDILARYTPAPLPDDFAMVTAFGHLFSDPVGYAAGYYSYQWAAVLDADAFSRFQRDGLFSRAVGQAFREHILSRGDGEDPATLFRSFLGRDPDPSAMLRRAGLLG